VIYGARIKQARLYLGETQGVFGDAIGLRQARLSVAEATTIDLPETVLLDLAEHSGFPPTFFERPPLGPIDVLFRARTRVKAADRNRALTCAEIVHESMHLMRSQLKPAPLQLPMLHGYEPKVAAREVRRVLDLDPLSPITNLTMPVERAGVAMLSLPCSGNKHDAFSWWQREGRRGYPVIAVLAGAPGDRLRWNIAHELGHLVLHQCEVSQRAEREADQFAAELLTPLRMLRVEMPGSPTLSSLYAMKIRWGVSVQSLIRRARDLGVVDEARYMSLFRQVSARGERMNERFQLRREKPRAYRKMAEVLFGDGSVKGLSELAAWTPEFAEDVLDRYATVSELPSRRRPVVAPISGLAEVIPMRADQTAKRKRRG
jgi:Zn-dependent peptidase ImmA (M78 family)